MLAVEIQGYGPGHAEYASMAYDYRRHNEAVRLGWHVLYFMGYQIKDKAIHKTIDYIIETINIKSKGIQPPKQSLSKHVSAAELFRKLHEGRNK